MDRNDRQFITRQASATAVPADNRYPKAQKPHTGANSTGLAMNIISKTLRNTRINAFTG
jgi:hypothetical protein